MSEVLSPRTDLAVLVQVVVVVGVAIVVALAVRRERALVLLTVGVAAVLLGLIGLRALH